MLDRMLSRDAVLESVDLALRTLSRSAHAARPCPGSGLQDQLTTDERALSAALMRVNHVGEVCAQAQIGRAHV